MIYGHKSICVDVHISIFRALFLVLRCSGVFQSFRKRFHGCHSWSNLAQSGFSFSQIRCIKRDRGSGSIGLKLSLGLWLDLFGSSLTESIDDLSLSALLKSCHMPTLERHPTENGYGSCKRSRPGRPKILRSLTGCCDRRLIAPPSHRSSVPRMPPPLVGESVPLSHQGVP
jgi:hypothetical protein